MALKTSNPWSNPALFALSRPTLSTTGLLANPPVTKPWSRSTSARVLYLSWSFPPIVYTPWRLASRPVMNEATLGEVFGSGAIELVYRIPRPAT